MDDATVVFDWLQTLSPQNPPNGGLSEFQKAIYIISALRQNIAYADRIIEFLSGKPQNTKPHP